MRYSADFTTLTIAELLRKKQAGSSQTKLLDKWAPADKSGVRRFDVATNPKLNPPDREIAELMRGKGMDEYYESLTPDAKKQMPRSHFKLKDLARRDLAGTGSLGSGRYYMLIEGPTASQDDDRILDVKE